MGQKVSPIGMRVGVIRDWESRWYAEKDYGTLLMEDVKIREFLFKELHAAYVSRIEIERSKNRVEIIIRAARPGVIIGSNGESIEILKKKLEKMCNGKQIHIKVVEVANPDLDAHLVARAIAEQLEQRASFRTCQKRQIQKTMRAGAKGIRTLVSGRLGGADIARSEGYSEGVVPLHTLRSDIDFAIVEAMTTYGKLGVKVWICRGEVLPGQMVQEPEAPKMPQGRDRRRGGRNDRRGNRNNNNNSRNAEAKAAAPKAEGTVEGGK
ncbi:30S ribosomal protein S3 [Holdemania massiliensis]|uniref:Small ribosomal subunit protein uS3 n=1 Tax=Holdemania massiliensis TaxID=1468449 RepID=A0A6N7SAC5_9FIRM|nr:30S ribosomal protein S3 [Holdemania massiliensis]MSA72578.1 30S ribosomal protein S3 [Holdemania massiliensis]MSA90854.1 30S ribosomal protein S3 [Holdemania massiliensis]MSB79664.1 30S ribosomal protein S3 [Holdemania massiliensis]MSC34585.1 30S ribosomal protein S3 [Holdemania massiliensis]MSC40974.1 30S ribosomal protein S3 [Holdemania massiliensis]